MSAVFCTDTHSPQAKTDRAVEGKTRGIGRLWDKSNDSGKKEKTAMTKDRKSMIAIFIYSDKRPDSYILLS